MDFNLIPIEIRAYLAGHFDGEGCVQFANKGKVFSPRLHVNTCFLDVLNLYQKYFNGSIGKTNTGTNKQMYRWCTNSFKETLLFCETIIPFSLEKKPQLVLAKEHIEEWIIMNNRSHPSTIFREKSRARAHLCCNLKKL
jgi:hypothetical protein